jgi:bifunctional enzyme CysN/CysC
MKPTSAQELFKQSEQKDLLRLLTAGSVDDGKSTLIGRLLYDSKTLYEDHLSTLKRDSVRRGSAGGEIDYSLLLDGLKAEREQGITIDVAYRYFSTPRRKFIIADTPGHEQYTRNMATGGSTADLAIILIDARYGVLDQTRRHTFIASLLGINHLIVAVNKMDLVDYSEEVFSKIRDDYSDFSAKLRVHDVQFIPISALKGDNVVEESERMPWYRGTTLLNYLETVHVASDRNLIDFRFPVQYVLRPHLDFRGFCGTVAAGIVRTGDEIMMLPSGQRSRIQSIVTYDGNVAEAFPPMAVTLTLEDEVDVSRGDMFVHIHNVPRIDHRFESMIVWMNEKALKLGESYLLKHSTNMMPVQVEELRYRVDVNTLHRAPAEALGLNEIGRVVIESRRPFAYDPYTDNRQTGAFILIDRLSNATVAAGMILEREPNELLVERRVTGQVSEYVHPVRSSVSADERQQRLGQKPITVWLTGLPKSGKSTVAFALERKLFDMGCLPHVLDGENLRMGISSDLGFSGDDRAENIRRAAAVARLCNDCGLISIAALVSPYVQDRENARNAVGDERFIEVYLNAPAEVCAERDDEGLYARAQAGEIKNFSGVTAPYEVPEDPAIVLPTHQISVEEAVERIVNELRRRGIVS